MNGIFTSYGSIRNRREKRCWWRRGGERRERIGNPRQGHMPVRKVALLEDDDPSTPAGFRPTPLVRAPLTTSRLLPLVLLLHRKVFHYLSSPPPSRSPFFLPRLIVCFVFKRAYKQLSSAGLWIRFRSSSILTSVETNRHYFNL